MATMNVRLEDYIFVVLDFENLPPGVKLCRNGQLCLIQMTLAEDPTLVYVIDIYLLTSIAIGGISTARGTSLKTILESAEIEKVW